jgi:maleate isomerase
MILPSARVGLIIPSSNRMVEGEMVRWFPSDVQPHVNRLRMTGAHHGPLEQLLPRIREAAGALADARCDAVVFHCTATAMEGGSDGEEAILDALRAGAHDRVTTTATAIRRALDALAAKRIVLVTPYDATTTAHEVEFLHAAGYDVVRSIATDRGGSDGYCSTPPSFWYETVRHAAHPDADVYFVSCANIACFGEIDRLERELGRPVITSNQTVIWDALRMTGTAEVPTKLGRLFAGLVATAG